jgi:hypothetical protein
VLVSPYPTPLAPVSPLGSLVYDSSATATISSAGDSNSYTIAFDAGQTASVAVKPAAGLQPTVSLYDSKGDLLGSAQASAAGQEAVLQTVAISTAGTYTITVQGASSTTGQFTVQLVLNAALQLESNGGAPGSDDTIAGAQNLTSSFISLSDGGSRAAVLGDVPGGFVAGDVFVSERTSYSGFGGKIAVFDNNGNLLSTISNPALNDGLVSGVQLGPDNTLYVAVDTSGDGYDGGELVHLDNNGNLLGIINLPAQSYTYGYAYPYQFKVASDGTFWVPQPSTGNVIHVDSSGNVIQSYYVGGLPEDVTVRADGKVFVANPGASAIQQLDPSSSSVSNFFYYDSNYPWGVSFAQQGGNGDLVVTDLYSYYYGVTYYNSLGGVDKSIATGYYAYLNQAEPDLAGDTFTVSNDYRDLRKYDANGNLVFDTYVGSAVSLAVLGVDGGVPTPPDTSDYYSFSLTKGQSATIDLTALEGSGASFDLENSSGQILAVPHSVSTGLSINEFVAQATGTYYVHVTGSGVKYDLVVTKKSDFDTGPNQALTQTQTLGKGTGVLGYAGVSSLLAKPGGPNVLYYADYTYDDTFSQAFADLGITPTVATSYSDFENKLTSANWDLVVLVNESNFDSTWVSPLANYVADGGRAILESWAGGYEPSVFNTVAAAFGATFTGNNDDTAISQSVTTDPIWSGISNSFALTNPSGYYGFIFSTGLQATSGQSIGQFTNNNDAAIVVGNNRHTILNGFVEDSAANASQGVLLEENEITALLVSTKTDYYSLNANASDVLTLTTSTPGGGSGQFPNTFDPELILYGPNGAVVAFDDNSAGDGRNAKITYHVATGAGKGTYTVEVLASPLTATPTAGEYVLSLAGNTAATPFTVTSTNVVPNSFVVSLPTSVTVDFSSPIYLPSLSDSSLTVDGMAATGFTVNNDHEVVFTLPALSGSGHDLVHKIRVSSTVLSIQGTALTAFSETITVDNLPPKVIKTSVEEGTQLTAGTLKYTITFDDTIDTSVISTASFDLHGQYHNTDYTPVSYSFNASDTALTITYQNLVDDVYTLTVFSQNATDGGPVTDPNGIRNIVGLTLDGEPHTPRPPSVPSGDGVPGGNFFVDFTVYTKTVSFSTLQAQPPLGSLVYQGSTTDVITAGSAPDNFQINLNAGETLTAELTSSNLQGAVTIYGPTGAVVGSTVTATGPGGEAIVQTAPVKTAGQYRINLAGASGTLGLYRLTLTLNAAVESSTVLGEDAALSASYYYEGTAQPGTIAGAAAISGTPTSTFLSTVFSGTTYNGGDWSSVPSFLGPDSASLSPAPANATLNTSYFDMKGTITVSAAEAGLASFSLTSDDGSILTIDGAQVVNDDGTHGSQTESNTVNLGAGTHTIELQYFNQYYYGVGGAYLSASGTFANGDPVVPTVPAVVSTGNETIGTAQNLTASFVNLTGGTRAAAEGQFPSNLTDVVYPANNGFESPNLGSGGYQYNPSGAGWTFDGSSGIAANNSGFSVAGAGNGNSDGTTSAAGQAAFLQFGDGAIGDSSISQVVTLPAGIATLNFFDEFRGNYSPGDPNGINVYLDGNLITATPLFPTSSSSFNPVALPLGSLAAGTHTITFAGDNVSGGDNTSFIDNVSIGLVPAASSEFYSFTANANQSMSLGVRSSTGAATLELLDSKGNPLALGIAGSTNYDQTISNFLARSTGTYFVEVQGSPDSTYNLVVTRGLPIDGGTNNTQATAQDITMPPVPGAGGALGAITGNPRWYSVNAIAGNTLTLSVSLPLSGTGQFVDALSPVITLFSPSGTQLATSSKSLSYKVPAGKAGQYAVEVTGAASTEGEYDLYFQGETGAVAPVKVSQVNPAPGALLQPPGSVTVNFSQSLDLATLSASELTVQDVTHPGQGTMTATSFTIVNDREVIWYLPSVFNGNDEDNHLEIAGGKIQDISGATLAAYGEDYTTDNVAPRLVSTSIQEGGLLPVGSLTYVATFSEPMAQSNFDTASFDLHGDNLNADYTPASYGFNAAGTVLTINYNNLPNDSYSLTLFSAEAGDNGPTTNPNGFRDLVGNAFDGEQVGFVASDNTGVDSSGNLLPDGAIDPQYTIVSSPDGTGPAAYVTLQNSLGEWFGDSATSKWISPAADQSGFNSQGLYDYETTVDITGSPANAVLTGRIATDDSLVNILVDGASTGIAALGNHQGAFMPYTIGSSFFHAGVNTIDFLVYNDFGPTGLRNEMTLTAATSGSTIPPNQSGDGIPGGNYNVDFGLTVGTTAFPVPLQPVAPLGSLVYQGSTSSIITTPTDVDTFTLDVNANETITVADTSSTLQGEIEVVDPNSNTIIGEAVASATGATGVLQTVPVSVDGVYLIEVSGLNGTMGAVTTQVTLNAAVETPAVSSGGIGLSAYYYYEGNAQPGSIAGAVAAAGSVPTSTFVSTVFSGTTYDGGDGSPVPSFLAADGASLSPAPANATLNTSYIDMEGTLTVSAAEAGLASFSLTSDDGSILTIDGAQVVNDDGTHGAQTESGTVNLSAGIHTIELQYFNQNAGGTGGAYLAASGTFANGAPVLRDMTATAQDIDPSFVTLPGNGTRGAVEGQLSNSSGTPDLYSFTAAAGQGISLGVLSSTGNATLELFDSHGNALALGAGGAANYDQTIANFLARYTGTYFVEVQGSPGSTYNLVVTGLSPTFTGGLAIASGSNNTQATAQDITATQGGGGGGALGAISTPAESDWYSVNANGGDTLNLSVGLPFSGSGQFVDALSPVITLFDPNGVQVATSGNSLSYNVPYGDPGQYAVEVTGAAGTQGEYALSFRGATGAVAPINVTQVNPPDGAYILPPTSVTVDFDQRLDLATLSASELTVEDLTQGTITATSFTIVNDREVTWYLPSVFNGSAEVNQLQIAGGMIQDISGATLATYTETYTTGTAAFPVALQPVNPLGSLIYQGATSSVLVSPTQVDTFTLDLNPNQTITVVDTSETLQGDVKVVDPNGHTLGEAAASGPGEPVVLETLPVTVGGVYLIEVSGLNGTVGAVTTQVTLNAAVQTASSFVPGLLETQVNSYNDFTSPGDPALGSDVVLYPQMGEQSYDISGVPAFPTAQHIWTDNDTWIYTGQIYFPNYNNTGYGTLSFAKDVDDSTLLKIDGATYINDASWWNPIGTGPITLSAGWHTIELAFSNGSGGAGASGQNNNGWTGWTNNIGFIYRVDAGPNDPLANSKNVSDYVIPQDDGTGDLFRTFTTTTTPANDTLAAAQDLTSSLISLGTHGASRAAVIGSLPGSAVTLPGGVVAGDVWVSERNNGGPGGEIALYDNNLNLLNTITNPAFSAGIVSAVQIGPDNTIYVGVDTSNGGNGGGGNGGELVHLDTNGNLLGIINLPNEASNGDDYPMGFKVANDGTFWVPQYDTGTVIHVDSSGNLIQSYYVGGEPEDVTVRADGQVFIANPGFPVYGIQQLDPVSRNVTTFLTDYSDPVGVTFAQAGGNGDLVVTDYYNYYGVNYYNSSSTATLDNSIDSGYYMNKGEPDAAGNTFVVGGYSTPYYGGYSDQSVIKYGTNDNGLTSQYLNGNVSTSLAVVGVNGPVPAHSDYYSLSLTAGQDVTIALTDLSGGQANLDLEDGLGNVLATGIVANTNVNEVISNFVPSASGTYYIHVSGNGVQYSLVVTQSADFSVNPNGDMAHAQNLGATTGELGAITANTPNGVYYYESLVDGATISLTTSTLSEGPGEFENTLDPHLQLEDSNGNVVATGMKLSDGVNEELTYTVPSGAGGIYYVVVTGENGTQGEFYLDDPVTLPGAGASTVGAALASGTVDVVAKRIAADLAWLGQTANGSDNWDQQRNKDVSLQALDAVFAQYG